MIIGLDETILEQMKKGMIVEFVVTIKEYTIIEATYTLYPGILSQEKRRYIKINGNWYDLAIVTSQPSAAIESLHFPRVLQ